MASTAEDSPQSFVPGGFTSIQSSIPAVIVLWPVLELAWNCPGRVAAAIAHIDVSTVTAWDWASAQSIRPVWLRLIIVLRPTVLRLIISLPRLLVLGRQVTVRIAKTVSSAEVPAISARRRMPWHAVLYFEGTGGAHGWQRLACIKSKYCRNRSDQHRMFSYAAIRWLGGTECYMNVEGVSGQAPSIRGTICRTRRCPTAQARDLGLAPNGASMPNHLGQAIWPKV
jgi:hypothetical protein